MLGFIRQGLLDFSISRTSLKWGIPIPWDDRHVTYVWFDALAELHHRHRIRQRTRTSSSRWWPGHHLIGKDIIRFHCVYWPAMLLSAGLEPPAGFHVHGWLLVAGEKMSKTKLNQITPADLVADFGVDGYRYHFLADVPFGPDNDFSYEGMVARYNSDLANNLGNLLSRVRDGRREAVRRCRTRARARTARSPPVAATAYEAAASAWDRVQPSEALEATWRLIRATNAELEATEPWKAAPGPEVDGVLGDALEVLRIVAVLAAPAIPHAAEEIWRRIGLSGSVTDQRLPEAAGWGGYPGGVPVEKGAPLFPRIAVPS